MEIKRCQRCHKLLRADAQTCGRCGGYDFLPVAQTKTRQAGALLPGETASAPLHATYPSSPGGSPLSPLPPVLPTQLSPHRAGHYAGLHPEDEPYQSSFLPVQRAPLSSQPALDIEEVEDLTYSTVPDMPGTSAPVALPKRQVASLTPLPTPRQQRSAQIFREPSPEQSETERDLEAARASVSTVTMAGPRPLALVTRRPRIKQRNMVVRLLLIISCFLFVVATGILSFLLIDSKPVPVLKPELVAETAGPLHAYDTLTLSGSRFEPDATVTISRDKNIPVLDAHGTPLQAHTFSTGNFFVPITIPDSWAAGTHVINATDPQNHKASVPIFVNSTSIAAPLLQLPLKRIDLGEDNVGTFSHKGITLTNVGGGHVDWQGSSDQPWLTFTPNNGTFGGSASVVITVDRTNLAPKSYTGHISFTQQSDKNQALVLTVTMGVNPASANLVISNAAFTFTGDTVTNPGTQAITIQNAGGQGLNWTATTTSGGNWLALSSSSGYLATGAVSAMTVSAVSAGLSVGSYQGTITFSYAGVSATPVMVTLNVNPPPVAKVALSTGGLSFHAIMGQNPRAQSFTVTNSGNAPLNWGILEDANGKTYAPVSQASGTLAPSKSVDITVVPSIAQAGAGTLNALITVIDTDAGTPVKSQQVKVTFTIVNQAVISLNQSQFVFNQTSAIPVSSQLLLLTNAGSAPLHWSLTITNGSPVAWITVDNAGGTTLNPGGVDLINVQCDSTNLSPGTFTATLTLRDTATVNPAAPVVVTVTVVVS